MGDFRLIVEAAGSHGCERDKGDGDHVVGCDRPGCVDCIAREYVRRLKRAGAIVSKAALTHWPSDMQNRNYSLENEVRDDLLTGLRSGKFPEYERYRKV